MMSRVALLTAVTWTAWVVAPATAWAGELEHDGWRPFSPRDEIRPGFSAGPSGLVIEHDDREGLDGAWAKTFEIEGDCHYRVAAGCRTANLTNPRHHVYVELLFHDAKGNLVPNRQTGVRSRPFFPPAVEADRRGWMKFAGVFRAPAAATHATVKLQLRWAPRGKATWHDVSLEKTGPRPERKVRLAAANYRPRGGKTALDNCRQLESCVARAAEQKADLVVLGECITSVGNGLSHVEAAEPVPGPSTDYLAALAKKHKLYLVTTVHERVDHLIYNTAVLVSPEGELVGKYRKVCLARDEYRGGVAPGREFPVFDTPIGRIGMMICFDVHMPEVARGLAANGAEIIAMPIMGGHPALGRARAIENQVYLVTSTYSVNDDWMQTGVWDLSGELIARATEPDCVVVAEVDLSKQHFWRGNMGDFKSRLRHERPAVALPD
ncbi:MAG: carbon-nitrogen hydrolase family protein [Planctomycetota bacterium]|jgi:predicted amidohydrolase